MTLTGRSQICWIVAGVGGISYLILFYLIPSCSGMLFTCLSDIHNGLTAHDTHLDILWGFFSSILFFDMDGLFFRLAPELLVINGHL